MADIDVEETKLKSEATKPLPNPTFLYMFYIINVSYVRKGLLQFDDKIDLFSYIHYRSRYEGSDLSSFVVFLSLDFSYKYKE